MISTKTLFFAVSLYRVFHIVFHPGENHFVILKFTFLHVFNFFVQYSILNLKAFPKRNILRFIY